MTKEEEKESCCEDDSKSVCCSIESVVSVDDRGQMVLPKEVREKAGINAGDKLAVVLMKEGESSCCITLIKVSDLSDSVKVVLGPVMKEIAGE